MVDGHETQREGRCAVQNEFFYLNDINVSKKKEWCLQDRSDP